jgi:uncharacterized protein YdaU (DUF1376 family)
MRKESDKRLVMHFYDFNIGDYAKKTQHLSNEEDLAYRRALDMYYDTEQPLPITHGLATLSRRLRVSEKSLQIVIDEFFPNGKNKHADEKIAEYHAYVERQKLNGRKGGRPKHKPTDNPVVSQNNPVPSQPLTTKPLTIDKDLVIGKPTDVCPHQEIISLYHQFLPELPVVRIWTEKRKKLLAGRWKESEERQNLDWWGKYFRFIATSDFLCGRTAKPFSCSLEWLVNSSNMVKVIEGNYDNRD